MTDLESVSALNIDVDNAVERMSLENVVGVIEGRRGAATPSRVDPANVN